MALEHGYFILKEDKVSGGLQGSAEVLCHTSMTRRLPHIRQGLFKLGNIQTWKHTNSYLVSIVDLL